MNSRFADSRDWRSANKNLQYRELRRDMAYTNACDQQYRYLKNAYQNNIDPSNFYLLSDSGDYLPRGVFENDWYESQRLDYSYNPNDYQQQQQQQQQQQLYYPNYSYPTCLSYTTERDEAFNPRLLKESYDEDRGHGPWLSRRQTADKRTSHVAGLVVPDGIIRFPRGPDGTNGFHPGFRPGDSLEPTSTENTPKEEEGEPDGQHKDEQAKLIMDNHFPNLNASSFNARSFENIKNYNPAMFAHVTQSTTSFYPNYDHPNSYYPQGPSERHCAPNGFGPQIRESRLNQWQKDYYKRNPLPPVTKFSQSNAAFQIRTPNSQNKSVNNGRQGKACMTSWEQFRNTISKQVSTGKTEMKKKEKSDEVLEKQESSDEKIVGNSNK